MTNDYRSRGIDTSVERSSINYNPILTYVQQYLTGTGLSPDSDYIPSSAVNKYVNNSIASTNDAIKKTQQVATDFLKYLKNTLKDLVVPVTDTTYKGTLILGYLSKDNSINLIDFAAFDRACNDTTDIAMIVEQYYITNSKSVEAMIYPDILAMSGLANDADSFINNDVTNLALATGYTKEDVTDPNSKANKVIDLDYQSYQLGIQADNGDVSAQQQYMEVSDQLNDTNQDPVPVFTTAVTDRMTKVEAMLASMNQVITTSDMNNLGGSDGVNNFIDTVFEAVETYEELKAMIDALKQIFSMSKNINTSEYISTSSIADKIMGAVMAALTASLLMAAANFIRSECKPAVGFLNSLSKTPNSACKIDKLANIIINVIENASNKFDEFILDYYRSTTSKSSMMDKKTTLVQNHQQATSAEKLLDQISGSVNKSNYNNISSNVKGFSSQMIGKLGG